VEEIMKFICLGYAEEKKWSAMSKGDLEAIMEGCFADDDVPRKNAHFLGGEALQNAQIAKTFPGKAASRSLLRSLRRN
jgi:hypothetical protein